MTDKPLSKKIETLYDLIEGIEIAMMTTVRPDATLVSRPMATQERQPGVDIWFVTDIESEKVAELEQDPRVALAYYKDYEWVSVSGIATVSTDREMIRALYKRDWKIWFGDEGGTRDGGPDDPRLALVLVDVTSAVYGKREKSKPVAFYEFVKGMVTGDQPELTDVERVSGKQLHRDQ